MGDRVQVCVGGCECVGEDVVSVYVGECMVCVVRVCV